MAFSNSGLFLSCEKDFRPEMQMGEANFFGKPLPKSGFWIGAIQEDYNQMSATGAAHSH